MKRSGSSISRRGWLRAVTSAALGVSIICGAGQASAQEPPDLKQAALERVAERHALALNDLQIVAGPATAHHPLQNKTVFHFKVRDTRSRRIYGVALDAGAREVGAENLQAAEDALHEARYGKLDPELAGRLSEVADETPVAVSIWLKSPGEEEVERPRRRRTRRGEVPAAHDGDGAQDRRATSRMAAASRLVVEPVVARLGRMGYAATTIEGSPVIHAALPAAAIREAAGWDDVERIYLSEPAHAAGSLRPGETHVGPGEKSGAVPFESLGQGDSFNAAGALGKPTILVFGDRREAARFTELLNDKTHARRIEDVDFTRDWVVVVVRGIRPTGGYGIQIQGVGRGPGVLNLRVKLANPAPRRFVTQALTYPYHVIRIQRSKLSIPAGTKWAAHTPSGELLAQTVYPRQPSASPPDAVRSKTLRASEHLRGAPFTPAARSRN